MMVIRKDFIMAKTLLQVRTEETDKEEAGRILEELGTNISAVVNMLIKQIILTKSIPFEVSLPVSYTDENKIAEVKATMAMEHMPLREEDIKLLGRYQNSDDKESIRQDVICHYWEEQA